MITGFEPQAQRIAWKRISFGFVRDHRVGMEGLHSRAGVKPINKGGGRTSGLKLRMNTDFGAYTF
jgi:hypothetical protein